MVPLGAQWTTASVADLNDDKTHLGQSDILIGWWKTFGDALSLWSRVNIDDNGILTFWIKIKRLVHHTIKIGLAISRFNRKRLWKFESGSLKSWNISRFQLQNQISWSIPEFRNRGSIYPGIIINKKAGGIAHRNLMIKITRIQALEAGTVEIDSIKMAKIRILTFFAAAGQKIQDSRLLIEINHFPAVIFTSSDLIFQPATSIKKIIMSPAIPLWPPDQLLTTIDQPQRLKFDIGIEPLFNEDSYLTAGCISQTDFITMKIPGLSAKIKFIWSIRQPEWRQRFIRVFNRHFTGRSKNIIGRIFELLSFNFNPAFAGQLENQNLGLGLILFARQPIFISLEYRSGFSQAINHPEISNFSFIFPNTGKFLWIFWPENHDSRGPEILTIFLLLLKFLFFIFSQVAGIGIILFSIGGQLNFLDGGIIGFLQGQVIIGFIHHIKIMGTSKNNSLAIRGNWSPARPFGGRLIVFNQA